METIFEEWKQRKYDLKQQNRKLAAKLAASNQKKVNQKAQKLHDSAFRKIDCLQCANCCTNIPPMINQTDIRRIAKHMGLKTSDFKRQYVKIDEDGDMVINRTPCPFLADDHTCTIYDHRPKACRQYPHTGDHEFSKNLKLHPVNAHYCPAVYHILEEFKKFV